MRRAALLLASFLALAAPAPAQTPAPLQIEYSSFTLRNGLHVILHEDHSVPIVSVNVWYHVGSANERPGRTGFAHLFEHLMFMGSGHVKPGEFDTWLESVGGQNNGSTTNDRTNYYIDVPSNALELALFLESDRMGYLLDTMTPMTVDAQRDVVKNERRQSVENQPYGIAEIVLEEMLYPQGHPYHWPVIGYMAGFDRCDVRRRRRVLQAVLLAVEREPGRRRRHRPGCDAQAGREVVRRHESRDRLQSR